MTLCPLSDFSCFGGWVPGLRSAPQAGCRAVRGSGAANYRRTGNGYQRARVTQAAQTTPFHFHPGIFEGLTSLILLFCCLYLPLILLFCFLYLTIAHQFYDCSHIFPIFNFNPCDQILHYLSILPLSYYNYKLSKYQITISKSGKKEDNEFPLILKFKAW